MINYFENLYEDVYEYTFTTFESKSTGGGVNFKHILRNFIILITVMVAALKVIDKMRDIKNPTSTKKELKKTKQEFFYSNIVRGCSDNLTKEEINNIIKMLNEEKENIKKNEKV